MGRYTPIPPPLIDDDTLATASASTVASSESVKAYVDNEIGDLPAATAKDSSELRIEDIGGGVLEFELLPPIARKPIYALRSDTGTAVNNDATNFTADDDLIVPGLAPGGVYLVTYRITYVSSTAADIQLGWLGTNIDSFDWDGAGIGATASGSPGSIVRLQRDLTSTLPFGGNTTAAVITGTGIARVATGGTGTLQVRHSQNSAEESDTTLRAGSFVIASRIDS